MEQRWITLFEGSATRAAVLRGLLGSEGIDSVMPDELTKVIDPFITGPSPFLVRVRVREADLARARALIASATVAPSARRASGSAGDVASVGPRGQQEAVLREDGEPDDGDAEADDAEDRDPGDRDTEDGAPEVDPAQADLRTLLLAVLIVTVSFALLRSCSSWATVALFEAACACT